MARRKKKNRQRGNGSQANPIVFHDLDGNPDPGPEVDDEDDGGDWQPPETDALPEMEAHDNDGPEDDEPEDDGEDTDDDGEELDQEPLEAGEAEGDQAAVAEGDEEVKDPKVRAIIERQQREIEELQRDRTLSREQLEKANKTLHERQVKELDEGLTNTRAALKRAIEEGDTDKQVELQDRLAELHATKRELAAPQQQPEQRQAAPDLPPVVAQNPMAERWLQGKTWVNNPTYAGANRDLIRIAAVLVEDGYDPAQEDYYGELQRRMTRRHPGLFPAAAAKAPVQRRPSRQQVGRVSRDDPPRQSSRRTVTLDETDRRNMRRFGLDPNDKTVVREYAKSKRESERAS